MLSTHILRFLIKSAELLNKNFLSTYRGTSRHKGGCAEWHLNNSKPSVRISDVANGDFGTEIQKKLKASCPDLKN